MKVHAHFRRPSSFTLAAALLLLSFAPAASADSAPPAAVQGGQLLEVERHEDGWSLIARDLETLRSDKSTALPLATHRGVYVHQLLTAGGGWLMTATERQTGSSRLVVLRGDASGVRELPAPSTREASLLQPTVIANDGPEGEPDRLLWIEGPSPRESRVLSATWSGAGWSEPQEISPVGPGTQIALTAQRLEDGSVLAVWAAYDGDDDEVVWSRSRSDGTWSVPRPISANDVPDVTPALIAVKGGALVAWSAYDGNDYRVYASRFNGESWSDAVRHGDRGSVFPSFATTAESSPILVYKQTAPAAWRVSELAATGAVAKSLALPAGPTRPMVTGADTNGVTLKATGDGTEDSGSHGKDPEVGGKVAQSLTARAAWQSR